MAFDCDGGADAPSVDELWLALKNRLRDEMDPPAFQSWVERLNVRESGGAVTIVAPNRFVADWVRDNLGYQVRTGWAKLDPLGRPLDFGVASEPATRAAAQPAQPAARPDSFRAAPAVRALDRRPAAQPEGERIAPRRGHRLGAGGRVSTFENFVAGPSNEFAFTAAREIARDSNPGFNPLFLHGGYGYGKTHLLHAIANELEKSGERTALHISGEQFTTEFCAGVVQRDTGPFKAKVRAADVLLLDDVQLIEGKKSTQEEFCAVVADLIQDGRQVVITADRPPAELEGLDARVRSLLAGGVRCDIGPADLDLRQRILNRVLEEMTVRYPWIDMPPDARGFLAARVTASPRELLGALNTLIARALSDRRPLSIDWVTESLAGHVGADAKRVSVDQIQKTVASYFDLRVAEMLSPRRARAIARPRQIAMYLAKELTTRSYPDLARRFGGRDHTTVIHAVRRIGALMETDPSLADAVASLRRMLES